MNHLIFAYFPLSIVSSSGLEAVLNKLQIIKKQYRTMVILHHRSEEFEIFVGGTFQFD
jgi:hypothetical protein